MRLSGKEKRKRTGRVGKKKNQRKYREKNAEMQGYFCNRQEISKQQIWKCWYKMRTNAAGTAVCKKLYEKREAGRTAVLWWSGNRKDFHHCLYSKLPHGERKDSTGNESGAVSQ